MTTRGIFILENVRSRQREGEWVPVDNVWVSPSYGVASSYIAGGMNFTPGPNYDYKSIVEKLQFSSDSIARSPSADLDYASSSRNPVASSTAAYWMSGKKGPSVSWSSKTSKTTFSTDTTAASPNYPSSPGLGWTNLGATATETTGYIGGGSRTPAVITTHLQKLDFSTDAFSNAPRFPQHQKNTGDALGNQTHGYWSGGTQTPYPGPNTNGATSIIARFTYSTETHSNVGYLPATRKLVAASGNATEGYIYGGTEGHPSNTWVRSTIIKLTYSTDTASLNPSNLGPSEYPALEDRGSGNLSKGYVTGAGSDGTPSGQWYNTNIFKFDYSTGTTSSPGSLKRSVVAAQVANASSRSYGHPGKFPTERWKDGSSETTNKGHFSTDSNNMGLYSLEMNTDSAALMPAAANNYVSFQAQGFSNLTNGWWAGGSNPGGTSIDQIVKTPYATDTPNPSVASMVERRRGPMIAGNMTHARIAGGFSHDNPGDRRSNFEKFTYSTESAALLPSVNLPQKDSKGGGSGNQELGYYTGGEYSYSWYYKVTYSTDTGAQVPSANQSPVNGPSSRSFASTLANFRAGASTDSVQKVPFADDTFSLLPSVSPANLGGNSGGAGANRTHGYYTHANGSSYMYKMSFATETADQLTTYPATNGMGNSLQGQSNGPVTANPNVETPTRATVNVPNPSLSTEGYWSGGYAGGQSGMRSITDRLTFATDTTSRLPGSNCPSVKHWASGSSSATKGYSNGGYEGWESPRTSNIYSLTYASGTWATAATLGETRGKTASINSLLYSWTGGGGNSDPATYTSKIDRLTFATETPSKNILQSANPFQWATGIGNNLAGYFCNPKIDSQSGTTLVEKLTYSTDSIALTPGLHVSGTTSLGARVDSTMAIGTGDIGYIMGGRSPNRSTVNKITFATDTRTVGVPLWSAVHSGSGLSSPLAGYLTGQNPGTTSDAYKMPFASETWTYTGPANASSTSGQQKTGFGAGMNGNAFPEITPIL